MDSHASRPQESPSFDPKRDDDADWDVSTDVSPPAAGCGPGRAAAET